MATSTTVPSLPNEILVNITVFCDLKAVFNLRLVDKTWNELIRAFENQIGEALARQEEPEYEEKIARYSVMPQGFALVKRVYRYATVKKVGISMVEYLRCFDMPQPASADSPDLEQILVPYFNCLEAGCSLSWAFADIYTNTKEKLERVQSARTTTFNQRLYREVTKAQLAYMDSLSDDELVCFRFFNILRSSEFFGWTRAPLGCAIIDKTSDDRFRDRVKSAKKAYQKAKQWATWCSLNIDTPAATRKWFSEHEETNANGQSPKFTLVCFWRDGALVKAMSRVGDAYKSIPEANRDMQRESAQSILSAIDKRVSRSKIRPSQILGSAFQYLCLADYISYNWKQALFGSQAQVLHY